MAALSPVRPPSSFASSHVAPEYPPKPAHPVYAQAVLESATLCSSALDPDVRPEPAEDYNYHSHFKATQKLVELPSDPQTKPLLSEEEDVLGYATDAGIRMRERKSAAERMSKAERREEGFRRITAYGVAEGVRIKLASSFLKREHNVHPRVYDNALYAMYNLPLLPGYGPASNIRSSTHATEAEHTAAQTHMSEAEESGYQGTYFARADPESCAFNVEDGYIAARSPEDLRNKARAEEEAREHTDEGLGTDTEPLLVSEAEAEEVPAVLA
ncbi:unnamed protein product [Peniophora sp. CBMAI 1063]|nr:unnamed protein product [Peniophora sp. CBMAI 1063]